MRVYTHTYTRTRTRTHTHTHTHTHTLSQDKNRKKIYTICLILSVSLLLCSLRTFSLLFHFPSSLFSSLPSSSLHLRISIISNGSPRLLSTASFNLRWTWCFIFLPRPPPLSFLTFWSFYFYSHIFLQHLRLNRHLIVYITLLTVGFFVLFTLTKYL